jgi:SAM-dependent methyltransferase
MNSSFDAAASQYDEAFTHTYTGKGQRELVWKWVNQILKKHPEKTLKILEINCGTGEDAIYWAQNGHKVFATDISPEMIARAQAKKELVNLPNLDFKVLDANQMEQVEGSFDMVFSNFGGLNCLSPHELSELSPKIRQLLAPNGLFIGVFMSRKCAWERVYYLAKRNKTQRKRRIQAEPLDIRVDGTPVQTWYYSPKECLELFGGSLKINLIKPIGIGYPPSYLNAFFENRIFLKGIVWMIENTVGSASSLANYADHFLISFKKE